MLHRDLVVALLRSVPDMLFDGGADNDPLESMSQSPGSKSASPIERRLAPRRDDLPDMMTAFYREFCAAREFGGRGAEVELNRIVGECLPKETPPICVNICKDTWLRLSSRAASPSSCS